MIPKIEIIQAIAITFLSIGIGLGGGWLAYELCVRMGWLP